MVRRKKTDIKVKVGDVFVIPLTENKFSYGQVIGVEDLKTYIIFDTTAESHPEIYDIVSKKIIFFAHTVDVSIEDGDWIIIGNSEIPEGIVFPEYVVDTSNGYYVTNFEGVLLRPATDIEKETLSTHKSISPSILEDAVKAYYGFEEWYPYLDKLKYRY